MKNHRIDILLATFNGSEFIGSQLDSILAQTHQDIHVIIRDDLSTDKTKAILEDYAERYPQKITLLPSEVRLGIKGNFSYLMTHSNSPYIMFSDQDDFWNRDKVAVTLKKMLEVEKLYPSQTPLLIHTDLKVVDGNLKIIADSYWKYTDVNTGTVKTLNRLLMQNVVTGCAMMMNRPLLSLGAPIPEECAMHDWWLALVAAAFGRIEAMPQASLLYRQHGKNTLGAKRFLSSAYFKEGLEKLRHPEKAKQAQAHEMLVRYKDRLNEEQKQMLAAFQRLPQASFFEKIAVIFKNRFFKSGFLRNAVNILFKKQ